MQHVIDHQEKGAIQNGTPFRFKSPFVCKAINAFENYSGKACSLFFFSFFFQINKCLYIFELLSSIYQGVLTKSILISLKLKKINLRKDLELEMYSRSILIFNI